MALHIGKVIRQHLEEVGMTKSEFARRISTSPQNIYGIFKRKSLDSELLRDISKCLNFDFFQYYSTSALIFDERGSGGKAHIVSAMELKRELDAVKKENEILRNENEYLKEIHKLMKEKSAKGK